MEPNNEYVSFSLLITYVTLRDIYIQRECSNYKVIFNCVPNLLEGPKKALKTPEF